MSCLVLYLCPHMHISDVYLLYTVDERVVSVSMEWKLKNETVCEILCIGREKEEGNNEHVFVYV